MSHFEQPGLFPPLEPPIEEKRRAVANAIEAGVKARTVPLEDSPLNPTLEDWGYRREETGGSDISFALRVDKRHVSPNAGMDPKTVREASHEENMMLYHLSGTLTPEEQVRAAEGREGAGHDAVQRILAAERAKRALRLAGNKPEQSLAILRASENPKER